MFFGGDDEELDFTSSTGRTKLASLFDKDREASQVGNESLTYTAPKEPKKRPESAGQTTGTTSTSAVLCAGVVFAYKFKEDKYASEGKLGVAVIGNHASNDYKLLLYLTKEKPVTFAKITSSFAFTIQPNNYVSFYDDMRQSWSLMFETEILLQQFAKQVALSKFCSVPSSKAEILISQDLNLGDGQMLEIGDNIQIKYSGWQLENNAIGSAIESSQLFRFRIGKQKAIRAWDEGVVGMKKNGKRLLICTPSVATGGEFKTGTFPSGVSIIFEVEIVKVKFSRERNDESAAVATSVPSSVPQVIVEDKEDDRDDSVRAKSKSISDQMAQQNVKSDKAKLISRMARMGQPMLPIALQHTDAPDAESPSPSPNVKPEVPSKPSQHSASAAHGAASFPMASAVNVVPEAVFVPQTVNPSLGAVLMQPPLQAPTATAAAMLPGAGQLSVYHSQVPLPFQALMGGYPQHSPMVSANQPYGGLYQNQVYPIPSQPPAPPVTQPVSDTSVPMMLMETRNQNTEVRVSLSRVSDKVDRISEKLDMLNNRQSNAVAVASSMPTMEVGMLVHNIERIVMENERLKKENMEKSSRVEQQNIKINELLQRNQLYVEQSNAFLEQRSDSYKTTATQSQAKVQTLEQEKVQFAMELSSTTSQLASCQLEISALKKREGELKQQLDKLLTADIQGREEVSSTRLRLAEQDQRVEQLGTQLKDELQNKKLLMKQLETLKENFKDVVVEKDNLEKNLNEKKKKAAEEIAKMEAELKEVQTNYEIELETLKNRLKMERNSTESSAAQKLTQIEDGLNHEWKEKCDRLLSIAEEKHQRELSEVISDKTWLQEKVENLEAKVTESKTARMMYEQEKDTLKEELDQLRTWKDKYDNLRTQATSMKERYEQRMKELEEERNAADEERDKAEQERDKAQDRTRRLQVQLASLPHGNGAGTGENTRDSIVAEVKKIMNTAYRRLRQEFEPQETYIGSDIHSVILDKIKTITLEMVTDKETSTTAAGVQPNSEKSEAFSANEEERQVEKTSQHHALMAALPSEPLPVGSNSIMKEPSPEITLTSDSRYEKPNEDDIPGHSTLNDDEDHLRVADNPTSSVTMGQQGLEPDENWMSTTAPDSAKELENKVLVEADDESFESFGSDDDAETEKNEQNVERSNVRLAEGNPETTGKESFSGEEAASVSEAVRHMDTVMPVDVTLTASADEELKQNSSEIAVNNEPPKAAEEPIGSAQGLAGQETVQGNAIPSDINQPHLSKQDELHHSKTSSVESKAQKDIPLFEEDNADDTNSKPVQTIKSKEKNSSLFGNLDDEDDDGLFSFATKPASTEKKMPSSGSRPSSGTKPKRNESDDDLVSKPPPLPLFGESDDEKDLDWLS